MKLTDLDAAAEERRYDTLYRRGYPESGSVTRDAAYLRELIGGVPESVIDLGCGNGTAADKVGSPQYVGVDISGYQVRKLKDDETRRRDSVRDGSRRRYFAGALHHLPYGASAFEAGLCVDVLEHLPESAIAPSLCEMVRVVRRVLVISVATRPASTPSPDGGNLHRTVKDAGWWERAIFGKVEDMAGSPVGWDITRSSGWVRFGIRFGGDAPE